MLENPECAKPQVIWSLTSGGKAQSTLHKVLEASRQRLGGSGIYSVPRSRAYRSSEVSCPLSSAGATCRACSLTSCYNVTRISAERTYEDR